MKTKQDYSSKWKIWQLFGNANIIHAEDEERLDKFEERFDLEIQINKLHEMLLLDLSPSERNKVIKKLKHKQKVLSTLKN